jgi:hypothetical protein
MIRVTPAAARELRGMLARGRAEPVLALRLSLDGRGGIDQTVGAARAGDLLFVDEAGPILLISAELTRRLDGLIFDVVVNLDQMRPHAGLAFRRPATEEVDLLEPEDQA